MKYRNGATNIGVASGFATMDALGRIKLHQNCCDEMALTLTREAGVRAADYDYEPVTVLYQVQPTEDPEAPVLVAQAVSRMAKHMTPKTFVWNKKSWPRNIDFYPFRPEKAGTLTDAVADALVEKHDWPQWVEDAADLDDDFAALLEAPTSNKHLQNRVLLTGRLAPGEIVETRREESAHDYMNMTMRQSADPAELGVRVRMSCGTPGWQFMSGGSCPAEGVPTTIYSKSVIAISTNDEGAVTATSFHLLLLESNTVVDWDLEPTNAPGVPAGVLG